MKNIIIYFAAILFITSIAYAQDYEIARWYGYKEAAVTYTFDDCTAKQFTVGLPLFDEYGYKMTLFTVTDWVGNNWEALQKAADNGHEVASHTITHGHFPEQTDSLQEYELSRSKQIINEQVKNQQCLTFAYPYCEYPDTGLTEKYYFAARGCSGAIETATPADFMNISSILSGSVGHIKIAEDFNKAADSTAGLKGWIIYLLHGIDDDGGYSPVRNQDLRNSLEHLKANPRKFWVTTFLNAALYIKERDNAEIKEISADANKISVDVTDELDNTIFNQPLTMSRILPADWAKASVKQGDKNITSEVYEKDGKKFLVFDIVPDNGEIVITRI